MNEKTATQEVLSMIKRKGIATEVDQDIICPFCHAHYLKFEHRPVIKCRYCNGKAGQAETMARFVRAAMDYATEQHDIVTMIAIRDAVKGAYEFELNRRIAAATRGDQ